jgi:tRNA (guanine-N7-)-methyltransferase
MDQHFLSNYLDASEYEIPLDLPTIFGRESETYLEVGFGSGEFLVQKAIDNSAKDFLGVELSVISTEKLLKSLKRACRKRPSASDGCVFLFK